MNIWQALIIATWVALIQTRLFGYAGLMLRFSPMMTSLLVGVVLGDIQTGVMTGAAIQLITMGQIAPGGQMPSEPAVSSAVATAAAIMGGLDAAGAVAIAIPVGLLGSYLYTVKILINSYTLKYLDKVVGDLDESKFTWAVVGFPGVLGVALHVPVMFIALYFGTEHIANFVSFLEGTPVFHVLDVVAGGLAAIGIATIVQIIGAEKRYIYFFVLAFFLQYMFAGTGVSTVMWAVVGLAIAGIFVFGAYRTEDA